MCLYWEDVIIIVIIIIIHNTCNTLPEIMPLALRPAVRQAKSSCSCYNYNIGTALMRYVTSAHISVVPCCDRIGIKIIYSQKISLHGKHSQSFTHFYAQFNRPTTYSKSGLLLWSAWNKKITWSIMWDFKLSSWQLFFHPTSTIQTYCSTTTYIKHNSLRKWSYQWWI